MKERKKLICNLFINRIEKSANHSAIGSIENGKIQLIDFKSYKNIVESITIALLNLDLKSQNKVCILSHTRKEWHFLDLGILCAGAITVPVYPSYTAKEMQYIIDHCEAEFLILENNDQMEKFLEIAKDLPKIKRIISIEAISTESRKKLDPKITLISYDELMHLGSAQLQLNPDQFISTIETIKEDDIATIVYTSGTTGEPKGAVIKHRALCQVLLNVKKFSLNAFHKEDRLLTFLPLSHVLGRCESFFPIIFGCQAIYAESINRLIPNISMVKPTLMLAVPRIFEKIYEKTMASLDENFIKKSLFEWANNTANDYFDAIDNDKTPKTRTIIEYQLAKKLVFQKIYDLFGGRIRYFISGGAPLSPMIIKFLRNTNLTVLEGYGLTETVAPCFVNPMNKQIPGTVGQPIGDVEIKFRDDGEILIKTEAMFSGYFKNPSATEESIDENGWFATGDIGKFNDEGFLRITDRKKDIIITSGGKNIAPQHLENTLKLSGLIAQPVIIGDGKKYLTALIGIEPQAFESYFEELEISDNCDVKALANHTEIIALVSKEIEKVNRTLASFETIKKFKILPIELTQDNYITPSMKIKRKLIHADFEKLINAMY